jgi:hypothetical protein
MSLSLDGKRRFFAFHMQDMLAAFGYDSKVCTPCMNHETPVAGKNILF